MHGLRLPKNLLRSTMAATRMVKRLIQSKSNNFPPSPQQQDHVQTQDIVAKLWHLCNILRDGGINYPEYVTELTYLLFLRMAEETGSEDKLPKGFRWSDLASKSESQQFTFYKGLLHRLG